MHRKQYPTCKPPQASLSFSIVNKRLVHLLISPSPAYTGLFTMPKLHRKTVHKPLFCWLRRSTRSIRQVSRFKSLRLFPSPPTSPYTYYPLPVQTLCSTVTQPAAYTCPLYQPPTCSTNAHQKQFQTLQPLQFSKSHSVDCNNFIYTTSLL